MNAPHYVTDTEGNRTAVLLDLATYQELLEAWEDADAMQAYDRAKAALADDELLPLEQVAAALEAKWAADEQQAA